MTAEEAGNGFSYEGGKKGGLSRKGAGAQWECLLHAIPVITVRQSCNERGVHYTAIPVLMGRKGQRPFHTKSLLQFPSFA